MHSLESRLSIRINFLVLMQYLGYKTNDRTAEILNDWWKDRFSTVFPSGMVVGYVDVAWQLISRGAGYTFAFFLIILKIHIIYRLCRLHIRTEER